VKKGGAKLPGGRRSITLYRNGKHKYFSSKYCCKEKGEKKGGDGVEGKKMTSLRARCNPERNDLKFLRKSEKKRKRSIIKAMRWEKGRSQRRLYGRVEG